MVDQRRIDDQRWVDARVAAITSAYAPLAGLLSLRLAIAPSGKVASVDVLCDTLRAPKAYARAQRRLTDEIVRTARELAFPKAKKPSRLTLPLVFARETDRPAAPAEKSHKAGRVRS